MAPVYIYSLACPETGRVRYIGKPNNMQERLYRHMRDAKRRGASPVRNWIMNLLERGLVPVMTKLCDTNTEEWKKAEIDAIAAYRKTHHDLLNLADGGDAIPMSREQRAKNGRTAAQARVATPRDAELYALKTSIARELSWHRRYNPDPRAYERVAAMVRPLAKMYPHLYGCFAGI